ncbi:MAG: ABC transporter ATP-binding protein [Nitriliruptoraceae bacterium]
MSASAPLADTARSVLDVTGLSIRTGDHVLIEDVGFHLAAGERVGLIGESGSGKSLTALSIMGLLPDELAVTGEVRLRGVERELLAAGESQRSALRGDRIGMVFQEPMTALNPLMRAGAQVAEVLRIHRTVPDRRAAEERARELLAAVELPEPDVIARRYPHQLSGGQRQRVMLAMALANGPDLLICDEPTTALDVTVQAQMLKLIVDGVAERDSALLFISHDLAVVATICDRILVMYGGRIVEAGPTRQLLTRPRHPYTEGLLAASDLEAVDAAGRLPTIEGTVPPDGRFPSGCVFRNRCPRGDEACRVWPGWTGEPHDGVACWYPNHGAGDGGGGDR